MAWYKDLSPIDYFGASASSQLRAIGWLEKGRDFANGKTSKEVFERLRELLADPWEPCVCPGWHECELCQFVGDKGSRNLFSPVRA